VAIEIIQLHRSVLTDMNSDSCLMTTITKFIHSAISILNWA